MPKISIITSLFSGWEFIPQFIENVKRQTIFDECEFLIINANEGAVQEDEISFRKFVNENKNVFWYNLPKSSVYEAWNYGIKKASSELVGNWNIDDVRFHDSLEMQVGFMEQHPEVDLCYGVVEEVYDKIEGESEGLKQFGFNSFPCLEFTGENMLKVNSPHCFPVWRKKIHDEIGYFNTHYFSSADYEMWLRLLFEKGESSGKKINMGIGMYYRNPNGVSSGCKTLKAAVKEVQDVREMYGLIFGIQSKINENFSSLSKNERRFYLENRSLFFKNLEDSYYFEGIIDQDGQMFAEERRAIRDWVVSNDCREVLEIGTCLGTGSTFFVLEGLRTIGGGRLISCECVDDFINTANQIYDSRADLKRLKQMCVFEKTCSTEDILNVLKKYNIKEGSIDFLILDGAEDAQQTFQQIIELEKYLKVGAGVFCHDWFTEKARLAKGVFEDSKRWEEAVSINPPKSIGCRIFKKLL